LILRKALLPVTIFLASGIAIAVAGWIYQVDPGRCTGCGFCIYWCPPGAIFMQGPDAYIDPALCNGCGECVSHCPWGAIYRVWSEGVEAPAADPSPSVSPNPTPGILTVKGLPEGVVLYAIDVSGRVAAEAEAVGGMAVIDLEASGGGVFVLVSGDGRLVGKVSVLRP
jgi:ferredoxin